MHPCLFQANESLDPFFPGWMSFMMEIVGSKSESLKSTPMEVSITWTSNGFMIKKIYMNIFFIVGDEKRLFTLYITVKMPKRGANEIPVAVNDDGKGIHPIKRGNQPTEPIVPNSNGTTGESEMEKGNVPAEQAGVTQVNRNEIGAITTDAVDMEEEEEFDFSVASEEEIKSAFGDGRKEMREDMINVQILDWKMYKYPLLFVLNTLRKYVPEFPIDDKSITEIKRFQDDIISIPNNTTFQRVAADLINLKCEKFAAVIRKDLPDFIMFVQIFTGEKEPTPGYALKYATGILGILQKWVQEVKVDAEIATGGLRKAKPFAMIGFKTCKDALQAVESNIQISHILNDDLWIVINKASMICRARKGWNRLVISNVSLDTEKAINVAKRILNFSSPKNQKGIAMIAQITKANTGMKSRSVMVLARTKIIEWAKDSINNNVMMGVGAKGVETRMKATVVKEKSVTATVGVG